MTNLERIRQMSSEELAKVFENLTCCTAADYSCEDCILRDTEGCDATDIRKWLESEVKE